MKTIKYVAWLALTLLAGMLCPLTMFHAACDDVDECFDRR